MPETKRPLKVFLCHAHSDKHVARDLYIRLTRDGVDAWLDKEKLLPGQDWEYEIRRAVRESDAVVVCLSRQFNEAGFRQKEVRLALDTAMEKPEGEIFIIPARLEECDIPASLRRLHWVDLFEEGGYDRLLAALQQRAHRIGAPLQANKTGNTQRGDLEALERKISEGREKKYVPRLSRSLLSRLIFVVLAVALLVFGASRIFYQVLPPAEPTRTPTNMASILQTGTPCFDEPPNIVLEFGQVVTHSICPEGDTDIVRFSGTRGDRIRIQVTYLRGTMRPCIELIAPDTTTTVACENAFNNVINITLDQTGSYTIVVHALLVGIGDYTLVVERL